MAHVHRLALAALLLLLAGTAQAQTPLMVAADHSLTVAQYIVKGVPSPARVWHDAELRRAVEVLQKLAAEDPLKLPRLESAASHDVFARLIAPVPLAHDTTTATLPEGATPVALPREPTTASELRAAIANLSAYAQPLGGLALLYAKPLAGDFCFDAELAESTRVALEVNGRLLLLLNRARQLYAKGKTPYWLRRAHEQVSYGSALTIRGALFIYSARRAFRPEWRAKLMTSLQNWIPTVMSMMPEATHPPILAHLHGLMLEDPKGYAEWQVLQHGMTFGGHGPVTFAKPRRGAKKHRKRP